MAGDRSNDGLLRIALVVLAAIVLVPILMMIIAMPMMGMMSGWHGGTTWSASPLWMLGMMLVPLVVLLGVGYLLYRGLVSGVRIGGTTDPALKELRLAYARGDVTDEEFEVRRERLERGE